MRTSFIELLLWLCIGSIAYNYLGYPLILFVLSQFSQAKADFFYLIGRRNRRCLFPANYVPRVALLTSVYNEEAVIQAKVKNALEIDYPLDRLEFLLGLDAPTDSTPEVLRHITSALLRVVPFPIRRGKLAVLCDLAQRNSAEILVFTDANTMLERNSIRNLIRHFADPKVGAVSGEEIRLSARGTEPSAELLYWRYESALKVLESRLNCSLGANGALYAVRRGLFNPTKNSFVEDFQIPQEIRANGYRVIYDPEAAGSENLPPTLSAQFERRARIAAGSFQTLFGNPQFLNPLNGLPTFAYLSHKVLRWITPVLLLVAFLCNALVSSRPFYGGLLLAQSLFYVAALVGYYRKRFAGRAGFCSLPFYFCAINLPLLAGLLRYLGGRQNMAWKVTPRATSANMIAAKDHS
jgi:cellulose synthase/poly-beta-1,6-N-acetylglucosamine synthase-like glycosyltransferase